MSTAEPRKVKRLGPTSRGRWLIHSRRSVHVLDLDAGTYERRPGIDSQPFPYDNRTCRLTRIEIWPQVGGRMLLWFDDPDFPDLLEHWCLCSRIQRIVHDGDGPPAPSERG